MPDFLLELFSEEIPARMQQGAIDVLQAELVNTLDNVGLKVKKNPRFFVTPRRLAVIMSDLPVAQPDISTELKGPKIDAPEAALQGFLKKTGMTKERLENRGGVYFAAIHQKGKPTDDVLKEIIEKILANFPWPKSMRWPVPAAREREKTGEATWVRPLHGILCIFDGRVVPVEFAGIKAGNTTRGHRFLAPEEITVKKATDYESALEKTFVIADREKRKAEILKQAEAAASKHKLTLKQDAGLLDEITGLVEWPAVLMGSIDKTFMDLPPEVLTTVMRSHQKYFALTSPSPVRGEGRGGGESLAPRFLIVANMETKDGGKAIIAGNERVLRARFSDARFFWDHDLKKPLEEWAGGLKNITFHATLGTVADKVERVKALAVQLAPYCHPRECGDDIIRAAALCKADLTTGMVGEFPELQGIMGWHYAMRQGEKPKVADAIRDHYKPQGPNDSVPSAPVSVCVALADKLDTLVSMFAIGEKPTGSKDPFALRRAALGAIRIILENNIRIGLRALVVKHAGEVLGGLAHASLDEKREKIRETRKLEKSSTPITLGETYSSETSASELLAFFIDRLKIQLKDSGIRHDVIAAVVADGDDDLVRVKARAQALQVFLATDDGANLLIAYRRAANILAIEEKKDGIHYHGSDLEETSLTEPEESALRFACTPQKDEELNEYVKNEQYVELMKWLATLRRPVDRFFDKIMVNCEDRKLRENRLRLLALIRDVMDKIANFGLIEG
ncbi:MAG: glycine--tRNA ligase subunit beta [Pseudomonadota bacterium]|nr:glycine--tRNA ligase subunit beta [Pseudomonadota bacterium]MDE3037429.1 glycine--tRNA ligase subunit beta [Pseudomonadota bacterium]